MSRAMLFLHHGLRLALSTLHSRRSGIKWGPWALTELIQTASLGLMWGAWLRPTADGSVVKGSEVPCCLQSILHNVIPMHPGLRAIYAEMALPRGLSFPDSFSEELEGFDAVLNFQCLLSSLKRARTSVAQHTSEAVIMSAFRHVMTIGFAFQFQLFLLEEGNSHTGKICCPLLCFLSFWGWGELFMCVLNTIKNSTRYYRDVLGNIISSFHSQSWIPLWPW